MYWIVSCAVLLVYLVRPSWVNSSQGGEFSILHSFLLLPHQRLPLLMVGWSLVFEVYFYLIFALSLLLEKTWQLLAFISWIILLVAFSGVRSWFGPDVFDWAENPVIELVTSPMSAEFVMGCLAGVFLKRENHLPLGIPCLALGVALLFLSPLFFHPEVALGLRWDRVAAFGFPSFLLVLGAGFLEPKSDFVRWRSLVAIGDSSYSLYLIHLLVFSAGSRMFLTLGYGDTFPELRVFLLFCLALLTGLASYRFLERPLNQVLQNFVMQWMYPPKKLQAPSIQALKLASE